MSEKAKDIRDTYFGMKWTDFIEIVKGYGFKKGFFKNFIGDDCINEEEIIFYHEENGLILYAESYGGEIVNKATVYGEVRASYMLTEKQRKSLDNCSYWFNRNGTMHFDIDVRKGLRFHLDVLSKAFKFSKSWTKVSPMQLFNYMDEKSKNFNYKEIDKINKQKLEESTPQVRKIIFG